MSEINFDGIPGPTHNYSGLAHGNLAAERNALLVADPRTAALQGIAKMRALVARGFAQAVLPPHERPFLPALRSLGFGGSDAAVLAAAAKASPQLLAACSSAAAMWTANAATVSPSADTADGRVHFTPANLQSHFHRSLEAHTTTRVLRSIFADAARFVVHDPLPAAQQFGDEGAANHTRFALDDGGGVEFFVHGQSAFNAAAPKPARFPARQTLESQQAIARRHGLADARTVHAQQQPAAIDAGVFHNDVIAVGSGTVLFCHQDAFVDQASVLAALGKAIGTAFTPIVVGNAEVPLAACVSTYLFNSQLLRRPDGRMLLVAPMECRENAATAGYLDALSAHGGGPACLRLRVVLTHAERAAVKARVFADDALLDDLEAWIKRHYRDRLAIADLADPTLLDESRRALDELSTLLALGSVYDFQRN
jgi:succinylarginine dihydrolase